MEENNILILFTYFHIYIQFLLDVKTSFELVNRYTMLGGAGGGS